MSIDLSERHELLSDLFAWPRTAEEWDKYRLTADQVAFYQENGYLSGIRVLDDAQVECFGAS